MLISLLARIANELARVAGAARVNRDIIANFENISMEEESRKTVQFLLVCWGIFCYNNFKELAVPHFMLITSVNLRSQAKEWGIPMWQHPQILFVFMGLLIITTDILIYLIAAKYVEDFSYIIFAVCSITIMLLVIAFVLQNSFERMAEASKMKVEFISIVSHQLRSPITNLRWSLDAMRMENKDLVDSGRIKNFSILEDNVNRMKDLVSNLLVASRLEANRLVTNNEKLDFNALVMECIEHVHGFAQTQNVKFSFQPKDNLPKILGDKFQINIVLENLFTNAIRYSRKGEEVKVELEKKGNKVYAYITDSGYGIPDEDKKYIFQKFFRATNVRHHIPEGSGLGLYLASAITKKLGGEVGFNSQMGKGSTFWVGFLAAQG